MGPIEKKYIFDEQNRKTAVQIDLETFEKIEEILEDYALGQLLKKNSSAELLDFLDAESFYATLEKAK